MVGRDLAEMARDRGIDAVWTGESGFSKAEDSDVLEIACAEGRTLVTLDEDFGDWMILHLDRHPGVIRVKVEPTNAHSIGDLLFPFLAQHTQDEFRDSLIILSKRRTRWIRTAEDHA